MPDISPKPCFILLPGFAPDAMPVAPLKRRLEAAGHPVIAANFWGSNPRRDFSSMTVGQCLDGVRAVIEEAKLKSPIVVGIGVSLGGALLLEHAKTHNDLRTIISIGTPFRLKKRMLFGFLAAIAPYVNPAWSVADKIRMLRLSPLGAAPMVYRYLEGDFLKGLERITTPVVFLHSKRDAVTDYRAIEPFAGKLSSSEKRIAILNNGDHVINYDADVIMEYV